MNHCEQNMMIIKNVPPTTSEYALNLGCMTTSIPYVVDPNSKLNLLMAFCKRISPKMPLADISVLQRFQNFVQSWIETNLIPLEPHRFDGKDYLGHWLKENHKYTLGRKRELMRIASENTDDFKKPFELLEKHYTAKSFVKREFYPELKVPRFINSRSDLFKAAVAPYIKDIESQVYSVKDPYTGYKYFVKHEKIMDLPQKLVSLTQYPWILETDYSSFESGFSPMYVDVCECALWRYMLSNNPEALRNVLRCYYQDNDGRRVPRLDVCIGQRYVFKTVGTRLSGEMWTSLGNGFSNLMNILFIAQEHNIRLSGFVEGDDGIFGMERPVISQDDFERLGFKIKMAYGQSINHTSFCGNIFHPQVLELMVEPEQAIRLFWTVSKTYFGARPPILRALLRAKAQSLFCQGKYTPIIAKLASKLIQLLGPGRTIVDVNNKWWEWQMLELAKNENFEYKEINPLNRELYAQRFNVSIQDQLLMEDLIERATTIEELDVTMVYQWRSQVNQIKLN